MLLLLSLLSSAATISRSYSITTRALLLRSILPNAIGCSYSSRSFSSHFLPIRGNRVNSFTFPSSSSLRYHPFTSSSCRMSQRSSLTSSEEGSDKQKMSNTLQEIHDILLRVPNMSQACHDPYANDDILSALQLMNQVTLEELGIDEDYLNKLTYGHCMLVSTINESFQIAVFVLPRGFALQLHDHPEMTVCSRMVQGAVRIRSFSGDIQRNESGDVLNATLFVDMNKSADNAAWLLTPSQGNFHEIFPTTDCVMLDILLPPYDDRIRPCKFYKAVRNNGSHGSSSGSFNVGESPMNDWTLKLLPAHLQQRIRLPLNVPYTGYQPVLPPQAQPSPQPQESMSEVQEMDSSSSSSSSAMI